MTRAVSSNEDGALLRDSAGSTPAPAIRALCRLLTLYAPNVTNGEVADG